jgi:hypothetical protein
MDTAQSTRPHAKELTLPSTRSRIAVDLRTCYAELSRSVARGDLPYDGFDMTKLSIVGQDYQSDEQALANLGVLKNSALKYETEIKAL